MLWNLNYARLIVIYNLILLLIIFTQPLHSGRIWHKVNF